MLPFPFGNKDTDPVYSGQPTSTVVNPTPTSVPITSPASSPLWPAASSVPNPVEHYHQQPQSRPLSQSDPQQEHDHSFPCASPSHLDRATNVPRAMRSQSFSSHFIDSAFNPSLLPALETIDTASMFRAGFSSSAPLDVMEPTPRIQLEFTFPPIQGKARKRHKVATSCNRCRQNKRKCDSAVPCSNCKRNNVDCCYTDAQLSRTIWGDSPLSQEKVIGVAAKRPNAPGTTRAPGVFSPYSLSPTRPPPLFFPSFMSNNRLNHSRPQHVPPVLRIAEYVPQYSSASLVSKPSSTEFTLPELPKIKGANSATSNPIPRTTSEEGPLYDIGAVENVLDPSLSRALLWQQDVSTSPTGLQQQQQQQQQQQHSSHSSLEQHQHNTTSGYGTIPLARDSYHGVTTALSSPSSTHRDAALSVSSSSSQSGSPSPVLQRYPISTDTVSTASPLSAESLNCTHEQLVSHLASSMSSPPSPHHHQQSPPTLGPLEPKSVQVTAQHGSGIQQYQHHRQMSGHSPIFEKTLQQMTPRGTPMEPHHCSSYSTASMTSVVGVPEHSLSSLGHWTSNHYTALSLGNHDRYYQQQHQYQYQHQQQQQQQQSPILPSHHDAPLLSGNVPGTINTSPFRNEQVSQPLDGVEEQKMEQRTKESKKIQRIAADLLAIKKYDYSIMIPRHISQEQDEFFIASEPATKGRQEIPGHLLQLPSDANYLVDVFFEHAYFYHPVINRAAVELCLMEPESAHALFLLNIVFMTACKHLARSTDIKRAIQFRERAREIQFHIDGDFRLSRLQGLILGSLVAYSVFNVTIGLAQICGTYITQDSVPSSTSTSTLNMESSNTMALPSLQAESQSIRANRGHIPEAAYQARLWAFWGLYIRDSMARLYLGFPHGMYIGTVNAELPKIEGCVGLGGKRMPLSKTKAAATMIRKPRDSSFKRDQTLPKIRQAMNTEWHTMTDADRLSYRNTLPISDDDEDQDEGDEYGLSPTGKRTALYGLGNEEFEDDPADQDKEGRFHLLYGADVSPRSRALSETVNSRDFSALSSSILKEQSKGHSLMPAFDPQDVKVHMERMKLLLDSENDATDDGSYCRVLFLKEVGLWSIGRRVALYLSNRVTHPVSAYDSVMAGNVGSLSPTTESGSQKSERSPLADRLSTGPHHEAGRGLEEAWLQDQELQSLQAELIAWDKALPSNLRFRPDVDHCNINHKVNGKMGILVMSYYTITIMLQSAYLPFLRMSSTKSPNRKSDKEAAEMDTAVDYDPITHSNRTGESTLSQIPARSRTDVTAAAPTPSSHSQRPRRSQSQGREYLNTPHQICSQLSNTLLSHVELMLDSYPNWCTIQAKVNHAITAALRVSCLNARLNCNSVPARQEAKAGFKMGTDLFKRLASLPGPLTITDWPAEEDIQQIMEIEAEFKEMMKNSEEQGSTSDESMGDASATTVTTATAKSVSSGTVTVAITAE